jgi:hypothetical protein
VAIASNESFSGWTKTSTTELLQLCERFFTTASPTVIAELHTFLVAEGVHPATALGWFTDSLAFATYHAEPGE